ncbi:MAG: TVP38/TMEM64 family protein [Sporomusaceae bacterium]|nr:TVP38/TMEM64 family protein [Sporomusaceae bacterium]
MEEERLQRRLKAGLAVLLLVAAVLVHWLDPALYGTLWRLLTSGNIEAIAAALRSYGLWAIAVSALLNTIINILGFLPSIFLSTANGIVFGIGPGIVISWLSECLGVIIGFYLLRRFFRQSAQRLIARSRQLQRLDEFSGNNGFKMMLVARALPYMPSGLITALGAVSSISFRDYALAAIIGKFPAAVLEVVIGYNLVNYERGAAWLSAAVCVAFVYWKLRQGKKRLPGGQEGRPDAAD